MGAALLIVSVDPVHNVYALLKPDPRWFRNIAQGRVTEASGHQRRAGRTTPGRQ